MKHAATIHIPFHRTEVKSLQRIHHPNIIRLLGKNYF